MNKITEGNATYSGILGDPTESPTDNIDAEETHTFDAIAALLLNVTLVCCVLLSYYIKVNRIYYLPESAAAMLVGVIIGGLVQLFFNDLKLFSFSPELFFFVFLPPIIFEAGYSLNKKLFFDNIGAIFLYAMVGTVLSCFIVGYLTVLVAKTGLITSIDEENHMEALLFGALISAVDPVATLSIMGSPELECDQLLYSLVFGESVLNDAVAIVLFKTFRKYYNPDSPNFTHSDIPRALMSFLSVSLLSIIVGTILGLVASFIFKQTRISLFPKFETALLFLFCYLCYAIGEALELSGIMALFFNGIVLSNYNSYNLSETAQVTCDQIFGTLAIVMETLVFLYMGMGVFTGQLSNWDLPFSVLALLFCFIARAANIFPLSLIANQCRHHGTNYIPLKMQGVLWFVGLRGAIAFALSINMPGPNKDTYVSATLSICMFTTIVCGGLTEKILSSTGMKQKKVGSVTGDGMGDYDHDYENLMVQRVKREVYEGFKGVWNNFDHHYLIPYFGGVTSDQESDEDNYEMGQHLRNAHGCH